MFDTPSAVHTTCDWCKSGTFITDCNAVDAGQQSHTEYVFITYITAEFGYD